MGQSTPLSGTLSSEAASAHFLPGSTAELLGLGMSVVKADVDPGLGPDLNCAIDRVTSGSAGRAPENENPC